MKKLVSLASLTALILLFCPGCASFVSAVTGFKPKIALNSNPSGATVTITGDNGLVVVTNTPAVVKLRRRGTEYFQGPTYNVRFEMPGYAPVQAEIDSKLNMWIIGNIAFGLSGAVGAFVVDPLTGGMWNLHPNTLDVKLVPISSSSTSFVPDREHAAIMAANAPQNSEGAAPPKESSR